jgi:hypothetical protein
MSERTTRPQPSVVGICPEPHEVGVEPVFGLDYDSHYLVPAMPIDLVSSFHDRLLWTRLLDPVFLHEYRQAVIELRNELDQESTWESEGGAYA